MLKFRHIVVVLLAMLTLMAGVLPVQAQVSLYDRFGGQAGLEAGVAEMISNWKADERINHFFDLPPERLDRLARLLVEQMCDATGGPCTYTGLTMKEAHVGLGISDADFDAVIEGIVKALNTFNAPEQEQRELILILSAMQGNITEELPPPMEMPVVGGYSLIGWIIAAFLVLISVVGWLQRKRFQTKP